ncbi:MAG: PQQ-dependent sugar dehydrogenase [Chloroflexi bacterium]|jgi:glucose/arabinose dehydrogenase|nr:PQQ-dependent sugar dehydrogenase [Chloroflexota bacterium]
MSRISSLKKQFVRVLTFLIISVLAGMGLIALLPSHLPAFAQGSLNLPEIELVQVAAGLERPIGIAHAGDDSGRVFLVEQQGKIFVLDGQLVETPFLDISDRVESPAVGGGNEEGLLGLAFPPGYADKGYFYVYYTARGGEQNVLSRFFITQNPNLADPDFEDQLLTFPHPQYQNHNGGQLAFGPDDYLYIGTGDGGGGGDPHGNSQDPASLNGKLLRIDVEMDSIQYKPDPKIRNMIWDFNCLNGSGVVGISTYLIPEDNPFIDNPEFRSEIWALGLRNPWRFSFDHETGDLFIADVGQERWEEINYQPAGSAGGQNYGWNIMEGEECYGFYTCAPENLTPPVHVYQNFSSSNCSIIGGYVYRGQEIPALEGTYVFGDFCSGRLWGLKNSGPVWQDGLLHKVDFMISAFGEDEQGEIYLADMIGGGMYKITGK